MPFKHLAGRLHLVTGAARGIGHATATMLVDLGAPVALCDLDADLVAQVAGELKARGGRVGAYALDVSDGAAFDDTVKRVEAELGPIDVLVNNAGIMPVGPFLSLSRGVDHKQIAVNVEGVIHGMRAVLPLMERRKRGHIVNVASAAGRVGIPFIAVYSATKHAVVGLTEAVRAEYSDSGIGFSYIMPALVDTELTSGTRRLPWPPISTPEDVALAICNAVMTGKVDVFVPRSARIAQVLPAVLPRAVYERVGRFAGIDRLFAKVDEDRRAAYRKRVYAN